MSRKYLIAGIDDDAVVLESLRQKIADNTDYDFKGFEDFDEAFSFLVENGADVILLDINMPLKNGFECLRMLKNNCKTNDIPVVFLTVFTDADTINRAFIKGAEDYIVKSKHSAELVARINRIIKISQMKDKILEYERDKVVVQFSGAVAHHLNQPLTVLMMAVPSLKETIIKKCPEIYPETKRNIEYIEKATDKLTELVQRISGVKKYSTVNYLKDVDILDLYQK